MDWSWASRRNARLLALAGVTVMSLGLVALASARCSSGDNGAAASGDAEGLVIEVEAGADNVLAGFTLVASDATYHFRADAKTTDGEGRALTASHMRQDAALGLKFRVRYRKEGGTLYAESAGHADDHED